MDRSIENADHLDIDRLLAMLARLRFAKYVRSVLHQEIGRDVCGVQVASQWLPISSVFASDASSIRCLATKATSSSSTDFFEKCIDTRKTRSRSETGCVCWLVDMDVDTMVRRSFVEIQKKYQEFFEAQSVDFMPVGLCSTPHVVFGAGYRDSVGRKQGEDQEIP